MEINMELKLVTVVSLLFLFSSSLLLLLLLLLKRVSNFYLPIESKE